MAPRSPPLAPTGTGPASKRPLARPVHWFPLAPLRSSSHRPRPTTPNGTAPSKAVRSGRTRTTRTARPTERPPNPL